MEHIRSALDWLMGRIHEIALEMAKEMDEGPTRE
jgi:hypothetical protein